MSLPRKFDFVDAGPYADAEDVGYRARSFRDQRVDRADQKHRERAFTRLQMIRTFDDMFVQSGGMVSSDRAFGGFCR